MDNVDVALLYWGLITFFQLLVFGEFFDGLGDTERWKFAFFGFLCDIDVLVEVVLNLLLSANFLLDYSVTLADEVRVNCKLAIMYHKCLPALIVQHVLLHLCL